MFYELLQDGTIGRSTPSLKVAEQLGLKLTTDQEIVYGCDNKRYLKGTEPLAPNAEYAEKRAKEYPTIQEQLDMIYWDKANGTNLWQEKIAEIKAKYPKP